MYLLDDYNYELPEYLIAQKPAIKRDQSNLMCVDRKTGVLSHHLFNQIGEFMKSGDVLVVNDTAVIPGRLEGKKDTGGKVEVLISDFVGGLRSNRGNGHFVSKCIVKASKRPKSGTRFFFEEGLSAEVLARVGPDLVPAHTPMVGKIGDAWGQIESGVRESVVSGDRERCILVAGGLNGVRKPCDHRYLCCTRRDHRGSVRVVVFEPR